MSLTAHAPCLRVDWASVCTILTLVLAVTSRHQPHWPGRPGVLADINRLPLTRAGPDSLHWHWALIVQQRQTRPVIGGEDSSLAIS